jgi:hypothetical protein
MEMRMWVHRGGSDPSVLRLGDGERRLGAFQALRWSSVPVQVVGLAEVARGEFAENAGPKTFCRSRSTSSSGGLSRWR